MHIIKKLLLTV